MLLDNYLRSRRPPARDRRLRRRNQKMKSTILAMRRKLKRSHWIRKQ
jgi:hypothetical protein